MVLRGLMVPAWLRGVALSIVCVCAGCSDIESEIESLPPLPESISNLPVGIVVEPVKSIAEAQLEVADIKNLSSDPNPVYRWDHPITIKSMGGDVQIVEYGVFTFFDGNWHDATEEQKPYSAKVLSEMFQCEGALLKHNETYQSDRFSNWSNVPRKKRAIIRWYFIGEIDAKRVRGETTLVDMPPTK